MAAAPLVRNGEMDLSSLGSVYAQDPIPAVTSIGMLASSCALAKGWFAGSHAGYGAFSIALGIDCVQRGEVWTGSSFLAYGVGASVGACYKPLEKAFGRAKNALVRNTLGVPKKAASASFLVIGVLMLAASSQEGGAFVAASSLWIIGNITSLFLSRDDQVAAAKVKHPPKKQRKLTKAPQHS